MLRGNERWIIHYHVHLEPVPSDGPTQIPLKKVLEHIEAKVNGTGATATVDNVTLRVQQMKVGTAWAAMLITNFDPRGAHAAYGDAGTGTVRPLARLLGESNAYSAHVLIKLTPDTTTPSGFPRHRFAIEDIPGIGKTRIHPFLNQLIRDNTRSFTDRQSTVRDYHPRFSFWPFLDESLSNEVDEGVLKHFELVKETFTPGGFDQDGFTTAVSQTVKLKPIASPTFTFAAAFKAVKAIATAKGFTRVKVVYNGADGNQRSAKFNPARQDLDDVIQNKYEKVELDLALTQCETSFSAELIRKIKQQM